MSIFFDNGVKSTKKGEYVDRDDLHFMDRVERESIFNMGGRGKPYVFQQISGVLLLCFVAGVYIIGFVGKFIDAVVNSWFPPHYFDLMGDLDFECTTVTIIVFLISFILLVLLFINHKKKKLKKSRRYYYAYAAILSGVFLLSGIIIVAFSLWQNRKYDELISHYSEIEKFIK